MNKREYTQWTSKFFLDGLVVIVKPKPNTSDLLSDVQRRISQITLKNHFKRQNTFISVIHYLINFKRRITSRRHILVVVTSQTTQKRSATSIVIFPENVLIVNVTKQSVPVP